mmetsp:Transcript_27029/g.41911  ORF Transcript_27029/g.41911 Transcript_27029/m.41911 type:complete len:155 (+) Transcript_27029:72-536(+)|eukprot:CAMPEP_0196801748 /NCGR_PEP_ID=MMETSP1362-20130617/1526_1 /TAXON_ID=163516 /ORGANISM="Leptocylindrus danicus, Strain CCMP1856" /LENGTH=154 /DNA_ID=CAMNT_0042172847 /DNA_START=63 /DNA_END=527 /DNA_ORIENTATION=-
MSENKQEGGDLSNNQIDEFREAFEMFDKDGDGTISPKELEDVMNSIGMQPTAEEIAEMIADVDEDQSGSIDFDEFLVMMKTRMDENDPELELKEAFKVFDLDGDGLIHWKELKVTMDKLGSKLTDVEVHAMIREADEDGDGAISYEEFKAMMSA